MSWRGLITVLVVLVYAACTGATAGGPRTACLLAPADSVYLRSGPVYRECAVDQRARLLGSPPRPDFRPPAGGKACYTAELEFVVDTAGVPQMDTVKVIRTNDQSYVDAILRLLPTWRYEAARLNGVPVRQIIRASQGMAARLVVAPVGQRPSPGRPPVC